MEYLGTHKSNVSIASQSYVDNTVDAATDAFSISAADIDQTEGEVDFEFKNSLGQSLFSFEIYSATQGQSGVMSATDKKMLDSVAWAASPKLQISDAATVYAEDDTDVLLCTRAGTISAYLPLNAPHGKRIIIRSVSTANRAVTIYSRASTDGYNTQLIPYQYSYSATSVAGSYYCNEFLCVIDENTKTRYWLHICRG